MKRNEGDRDRKYSQSGKTSSKSLGKEGKENVSVDRTGFPQGTLQKACRGHLVQRRTDALRSLDQRTQEEKVL